VGHTRQRGWKRDGGIDLESQGFFDTMAHALLMRAVQKHAKDQGGVLSSARWLTAPAPAADGHVTERGKGTPPGGGARPLWAHLFVHSAFDRWRQRTSPPLPFARDADDAMGHWRTETEAQEVRRAMAERLQACRRALHPDKTKIVSCTEEDRRGTDPNAQGDCRGSPCRPRRSQTWQGQCCINFRPAVADKAGQAMRAAMRRWPRHVRSEKSREDRARMFHPKVRGGLQYYGRYDRSALSPIMRQLDRSLARWAYRRYKKLRGHVRRATPWLARISRRAPGWFAHWQMGVRRGSTAGAV
jgi:RNA-directed DNA polymerase